MKPLSSLGSVFTCALDTCGRRRFSNGLCSLHFFRARTHGALPVRGKDGAYALIPAARAPAWLTAPAHPCRRAAAAPTAPGRPQSGRDSTAGGAARRPRAPHGAPGSISKPAPRPAARAASPAPGGGAAPPPAPPPPAVCSHGPQLARLREIEGQAPLDQAVRDAIRALFSARGPGTLTEALDRLERVASAAGLFRLPDVKPGSVGAPAVGGLSGRNRGRHHEREE